MRNRYNFRIAGIYHSGRIRKRWNPRTEEKFDSMVGCLCDFDPDEVEQFKGVHFNLKDHPNYDWWDTTGIVQLARDFDGNYILETVNTIYVFEEVK